MKDSLRPLFIAAAGFCSIVAASGCAPEASFDPANDRADVEEILAKLDQTTLPAEDLADLYLDDAVILQPGEAPVSGREEIVALMERQAAGPALDMTHRADDISSYDDLIVVQGGVTGAASPADGSGPFAFATKNLIVFRRDENGDPKIWKVIFNAAPETAQNQEAP